MIGRPAVEIRALRPGDDRQTFRSGDEALDLFFHRFAGQNQFRHHVGVSYVALEAGQILGFVTVSPATLDTEALPSGRRMPPYPLPVLRIARLAVDARARGRGLGRALLRYALELAERMRDELGCVGVLVDAKPDAVGFYADFGFTPVTALEGAARTIPAATPLYLPLGAIPGARQR